MSTLPAKVVPLQQRRRGLSWLLGLGAFGLAFSLTTTSAYLPPLLERFTDSRTLIAVILGSEGLFALTLPLVIGPWSDTFQTPMGRRRPSVVWSTTYRRSSARRWLGTWPCGSSRCPRRRIWRRRTALAFLKRSIPLPR